MAINWTEVGVQINSAMRIQCEPGWHLASNWAYQFDDLVLWFVWAGRGQMQLPGSRHVELRPGIGLLARPGRTYSAQQEPSDRLGVSSIHFDLLKAGRPLPVDDSSLPPQINDLVDVSYADAVLKRVVELANRGSSSVSDECATAAGTTLFTGLLMDLEQVVRGATRGGQHSPVARDQQRLMLAIGTRICESPAQSPTVSKLAQQAGYSIDHFTRIFKEVLGQTPQAFIIRQRMSRARQLLIESRLSIGEVAQVLGYDNVYFFSRQFKEKIGCSPRQYRNSTHM